MAQDLALDDDGALILFGDGTNMVTDAAGECCCGTGAEYFKAIECCDEIDSIRVPTSVIGLCDWGAGAKVIGYLTRCFSIDESQVYGPDDTGAGTIVSLDDVECRTGCDDPNCPSCPDDCCMRLYVGPGCIDGAEAINGAGDLIGGPPSTDGVAWACNDLGSDYTYAWSLHTEDRNYARRPLMANGQGSEPCVVQECDVPDPDLFLANEEIVDEDGSGRWTYCDLSDGDEGGTPQNTVPQEESWTRTRTYREWSVSALTPIEAYVLAVCEARFDDAWVVTGPSESVTVTGNTHPGGGAGPSWPNVAVTAALAFPDLVPQLCDGQVLEEVYGNYGPFPNDWGTGLLSRYRRLLSRNVLPNGIQWTYELDYDAWDKQGPTCPALKSVSRRYRGTFEISWESLSQKYCGHGGCDSAAETEIEGLI